MQRRKFIKDRFIITTGALRSVGFPGKFSLSIHSLKPTANITDQKLDENSDYAYAALHGESRSTDSTIINK
jgi:hypothetical protein